jgi:hypothetical protein
MHGLLVEGVFSLSSNSTSKSSMYGGGAGYRWHWSGQRAVGVPGVDGRVLCGQRHEHGDERWHHQHLRSDHQARALGSSPNIGKRWARDSGINITFRIGAGWAGYKVSSNSTDPNVQMGVDALQDLLELIPHRPRWRAVGRLHLLSRPVSRTSDAERVSWCRLTWVASRSS